MKKGKFSTEQIAKILKEFEQGKSVDDISREHGILRLSSESILFAEFFPKAAVEIR
jgi:hypothetical protein